jgi:hypothetical protein
MFISPGLSERLLMSRRTPSLIARDPGNLVAFRPIFDLRIRTHYRLSVAIHINPESYVVDAMR